ncbi:unnamed protein product [Mytilus coruscus]|uniref:Uncharacterized protein n=1 Tax=Mytilus coruscus TaxID=42192 RepID=A0A6J8D2X0_MYTCO|nr:unnamed protein product [Mytilus coruscus]
MNVEIQQYLQDYRPSKALPKVGDGIFYNYVDTTKGITGAERDELTSFLKNDASELVVLNDPSNYVACNTEQRQIIATVDSPTLRVKCVLGQESPSCQASVSSVVAPITTKAKSSITKPVSVTQPKKKQTYQELQIEVLKLDKKRILQEKRKIISEREKLELEKTLLKLKIKKLKQEFDDNEQ